MKWCIWMAVGRANLTRDELLISLVQIEAVINSRPLSYVSSAYSKERIMPSHLIVGLMTINLPDHLGNVFDPENGILRSALVNWPKGRSTSRVSLIIFEVDGGPSTFVTWESAINSKLRKMLMCLMWTREISSLSMMTLYQEDIGSYITLHKIQKVYNGKEGILWSALVKVTTWNRKHVLLKRPLQLLYPLEVHHNEYSLDTKLFQNWRPFPVWFQNLRPRNNLPESKLRGLGRSEYRNSRRTNWVTAIVVATPIIFR